MSDPNILLNIIDNLPEGATCELAIPGSEEELKKVERQLKAPLPEEYRRLMLRHDGIILVGPKTWISLFSIHDLVEITDRYAPEFRYMIVFANDGGDQVYYMDPLNHLQHGPGAVFNVYAGSGGSFEDSRYSGRSLAEFFEKIASGEDPRDAPRLEDDPAGVPESATAHLRNIDYAPWLEWARGLQPPLDLVQIIDHPIESAHWDGSLFPDHEPELIQYEEELGVRLPESHRQLLLHTGGGSLRHGLRAGISIFDARDILTGQYTNDMIPDEAPELADFLCVAEDSLYFRICYDVEDYFGRGAWSVYALHRLLIPREQIARAIYIGRDFKEVLCRVMTGEDIIDGFYKKEFMHPPDPLFWAESPFR